MKIKFFSFFICLFIVAINAYTQPYKKANFILEKTYKFERGYTNNFMAASGDTVMLSCPDLRTIYIISSTENTIEKIEYKYGRGAGEVSRGPFGIDYDNETRLMYLADVDAQRFSVYDFSNKTFKTELFRAEYPLYGINNYNGSLILVSPSPSPRIKVAAFLYNPVTKNVMQKYLFPTKTDNPFRHSGMVAETSNYIIHASWYYAEILVWQKSTGQYVRGSQIMSVKNLQGKKAKLGNFSGMIPPRNPPLRIRFSVDNPVNKHRVFLLMQSKDGEYKTNYVYDYDFMKDEVVDKFKLPAKATLLASNKDYLFVYSEEKDEMYQYKLEFK